MATTSDGAANRDSTSRHQPPSSNEDAPTKRLETQRSAKTRNKKKKIAEGMDSRRSTGLNMDMDIGTDMGRRHDRRW